MYQQRIALYTELEKLRNSKLLIYFTGDRQGLEAQISQDAVDFFVDHLDKIGIVPKISLVLYTRGGQTLAAWTIANLIRQFCDDFEVIVPSKAHSAGTLICLGADRIVMTKQATLGPIDPNVNTPLNPTIAGAPTNARFPVSVEAINGFTELAKELGIKESSDMTSVLSVLATHVHPLVLGEVFRTRGQIKMLGERLLSHSVHDSAKISKVLEFLCSESGSHDYTIYHREAKDDLGLTIESPSDEDYHLIRNIYCDLAEELRLTEPYNPGTTLGEDALRTYEFKRAFLESVAGGSHSFVSAGQLRKQQIPSPTGLQDMIQDQRSYEGWKHEPAA